jgi:hypothetical protein
MKDDRVNVLAFPASKAVGRPGKNLEEIVRLAERLQTGLEVGTPNTDVWEILEILERAGRTIHGLAMATSEGKDTERIQSLFESLIEHIIITRKKLNNLANGGDVV